MWGVDIDPREDCGRLLGGRCLGRSHIFAVVLLVAWRNLLRHMRGPSGF